MAHIPKGSLVKGSYKPIRRDCAIYFSIDDLRVFEAFQVFWVGQTTLRYDYPSGKIARARLILLHTPTNKKEIYVSHSQTLSRVS